ncbi:caspase domain-containing protein [Hysterangium stoloniferum]|nr:caspase domain-containing protein [Hysterangium stoloniferum]
MALNSGSYTQITVFVTLRNLATSYSRMRITGPNKTKRINAAFMETYLLPATPRANNNLFPNTVQHNIGFSNISVIPSRNFFPPYFLMPTRPPKAQKSPAGNVTRPQPTPPAPRRRALLVAISYKGRDGGLKSLASPLQELPKVKRFLINNCGFVERDITILSDGPAKEHITPTRENILGKLKELVAEAARGDHFFFWYSGHGGQVTNENGTEPDDRRDELICPVDCIKESKGQYKNFILDDTLREILVSPLPVGARLVALIDSCHSGTMLDLQFPWSVHGEGKEQHPYKWKGHAISISASSDGQVAYSTADQKRLLLTKAFIQTLEENPNQTPKTLLQSLNTLISKDLNGAHKQDPQMGFTHRSDYLELFSI